MRARLLLAATALLFAATAAPATAALRVMCYGDSITAGLGMPRPEDSYPGQLQRLRPDLEVVNEGRSGDVSDNADRFRRALADWTPQLVVLMLGTNDAMCSPPDVPPCASSTATPERSVANLLRMADEARRAGAAVVILTPTPAVCNTPCQAQPERAFGMTVRDAFTERIAEELRHAHPPAGVHVADLRGKFTAASWTALSPDGLHPSTEGSRLIAEFVATQIPKSGTPQHDTAKRDSPQRDAATRETPKPSPADEPDPFVRRPPGARSAR